MQLEHVATRGNTNNRGERLINIGFSSAEIQELIWLIDDEPVSEEALRGIRKKLKNRQKRMKRVSAAPAST